MNGSMAETSTDYDESRLRNLNYDCDRKLLATAGVGAEAAAAACADTGN